MEKCGGCKMLYPTKNYDLCSPCQKEYIKKLT